MHCEHVRHIDGQRQDDRENLDDHAVDELPHGIHVSGRPIDDRAALPPVEKPEAQPLQLVVNVRTQLNQDALTQRGDGNRCRVPHGGRRQSDSEDQSGNHCELAEDRPLSSECEPPGETVVVRWRIQVMTDQVNPDAGEAQTAQAERNNQDVQRDDARTTSPIAPAQADHPENQRPI